MVRICYNLKMYLNDNGFGCIQNQSLDKCKQIRQFRAHENGLDASKTNPAGKCKSIHRF